jgi:protoporphyrinogen oxidase
MNVCVVGGGLSGIVAGYRLSLKGHRVTIIEKEGKTGGLMRSFGMDGDKIPIVYHHIMRSDNVTKGLIKELGLWKRFYKKKTKMGFFYDDKIYNLSTPFNIIKFDPLSFSSRMKFIIFGLKVMLKRRWDDLEDITAKDWVTKSANREIYEKIFEPLLKIKFSGDSDSIIARWVGERLKMGESSGPFGYMKGGLEQILDVMEHEIIGSGGAIRPNSTVIKFKMKNNRIKSIILKERGKVKELAADRVIYTGPVSGLTKMAEFPSGYKKKLNSIKYKSTICAVIGLDKDISDYYWINLISGNFSFGGIITHTVLNPYIKSAESVLYVFVYLDKNEALWHESDDKILDKYISELDLLFGIRKNIKWKRLFRVEFSKPVYDMEYKDNVLGCRTPIENLYLGGTALFYPKIRNMGSAIRTGIKLSDIVDSS